MGFSRQEYWSGVPLPSPFICICRYIEMYIDSKENKTNIPNCSLLLSIDIQCILKIFDYNFHSFTIFILFYNFSVFFA